MSLIVNGVTATELYVNGTKTNEAWVNGSRIIDPIAYATARVDEVYDTATSSSTPTSFTITAGTQHDGSVGSKMANRVYVENSSNVSFSSSQAVYGGSTDSSAYYNPYVRMVIGKTYLIKYRFNIKSIGTDTNHSTINYLPGVIGMTKNSSTLYVNGVLKMANYLTSNTYFTNELVEFTINATITSDTSNGFYFNAYSFRGVSAGYVAIELSNVLISVEEI